MIHIKHIYNIEHFSPIIFDNKITTMTLDNPILKSNFYVNYSNDGQKKLVNFTKPGNYYNFIVKSNYIQYTGKSKRAQEILFKLDGITSDTATLDITINDRVGGKAILSKSNKLSTVMTLILNPGDIIEFYVLANGDPVNIMLGTVIFI